jgi:hypothetical protein
MCIAVSDRAWHLVVLAKLEPACLPACCLFNHAELEGLHREVLLRALQLLEPQGKVK